MNIPQIEIPPDLPDDARALVEEVNRMLSEATRDVAALNSDREGFTAEGRAEIIERSERILQRFIELREQLRGYGLEWSEEWPEVIDDGA